MKVTKDILEKILTKELRTVEDIADELHITPHMVYYYAKKYSIDMAARKKLKKEKGIRNINYMDIPKDELYELYINKGMTVTQLSKKYYCSHATICYRLDEYGIPRRLTGRRKINV